ncbi:unnamed protein product [Peniophora sp. CBMAI 1063]|nr:unnamed protein product [Peniophora sp. CBMAI 1063]
MAAGVATGGAEALFHDATPFPTDLPTDRLLHAAVRLCNAISAQEAQNAKDAASDSPLSPLTASSAGTPTATASARLDPSKVTAALDALLDEASALQRAEALTDSDESSSENGGGRGEEDGSSQDEEDAYSAGEGRANGVEPKRKRKRKRKGKGGDGGKSSARNNGQDNKTNSKKEYQKKKRRKKRQQDRFDAANGAPYDRRHKKLFYKRTHCIRLWNLKTFEVRYATGPGGYIGKKKFAKKLYTVEELVAMGFKELPWDGEDTILLLDKDNRVVCVLVGRPQGMTPEERAEWDSGMADLARAFEEERLAHQDELKKNLRGPFDAFATGFTMGPGAKKPSNLDEAMNAGLRATSERLLAHGQLRRLAGFASECVAHYFPLAFLHMRRRLEALCKHDEALRFPFGGLSMYPACTFNLGPYSACFSHTDGSNYPGIPCTVSPFGPYDPARGGHFILFDFKLFFKFRPGTTVALSSAGLRHGNTALAPGDKRYGFTQYCSGALIRYVAYGFRLVGNIPAAVRELIDAEAGEGWQEQLGRFSTWSGLLVDRKKLTLMSLGDWDAPQLTWEAHLERGRSEYAPQWPANDDLCVAELGEDGTGAFHMLERGGLDKELRANDVIWYFGDDGGRPTPPAFALFSYVTPEGTADDVGADDDGEDDLHGPDDPEALAPRTGVEMCAMLVKAVVSYPAQGAEGGRCTWVLGHAFSMPRYLRAHHLKRGTRVEGDVLSLLHQREHILTDMWQAARLHNVVAVGSLRTLFDDEPSLPPPVGMPEEIPVYWSPGCLHGLDAVRNGISKQALNFKTPLGVASCRCSRPGCAAPQYDRAEHTMARCPRCARWFHQSCVQDVDDPDFAAFDIEWAGGKVSGPATRRTPNQSAAVFKHCMRGIALRMDPPVRTWERVVTAAQTDEARYWAAVDDSPDGEGFQQAWRDAVVGGRNGISADEATSAVSLVMEGGAGFAWPKVCFFCEAPM